MKAEMLLKERRQLSADAFVELRVWRVVEPVRGSSQDLKYSLAYVAGGVCVLRYDNEAGKGDHRHVDAIETPYSFKTAAQLLVDFWNDVDQWRPK